MSSELEELLQKLSIKQLADFAERVGLTPPSGIISKNRAARLVAAAASETQRQKLKSLILKEGPKYLQKEIVAAATPESKVEFELSFRRISSEQPAFVPSAACAQMDIEVVRSAETGPDTFTVTAAVPESRRKRLYESSTFANDWNGWRVVTAVHLGKLIYEWLPIDLPPVAAPKDVPRHEIEAYAELVDAVILTATDIERDAVRRTLKPFTRRFRKVGPVRGVLDDFVLTVGRMGRVTVGHVECHMGSSGRRSSSIVTMQAIAALRPAAVLIPGIAFGKDNALGKQRLGDVLVAETIAPYEAGKISGSEIEPRGQPISSGSRITSRFLAFRDVEFAARGDLTRPTIRPGILLSGEKVINSSDFKAAIQKIAPAAIGGEMEGTGAYSAASAAYTEVLLVKSICDWADGTKNDDAQAFAAQAAVGYVASVLAKHDVLSDLPRRKKQSSHSAKLLIASVSAILILLFMLLSNRSKASVGSVSPSEIVRSEFLRFDLKEDCDVELALSSLKQFEEQDDVLRPAPPLFDLELETQGKFGVSKSSLPNQTATDIANELRKVASARAYPTRATLNAQFTVVRGPGFEYSITLKDGGVRKMSVAPMLDDGGVAGPQDSILLFDPAMGAENPGPQSRPSRRVRAVRRGNFEVSQGRAELEILIGAGETVVLEASGTIGFGGVIAKRRVDPNGEDSAATADSPAPALRNRSLICAVEGLPWEQVGAYRTFRSSRDASRIVCMANTNELPSEGRWTVLATVHSE